MAPTSPVISRTLIQCLVLCYYLCAGLAAPGGDLASSSAAPLDETELRATPPDAQIPRPINPCPVECVCASGYVQCANLINQLLPDNIPKDVVDLRLSGNHFDIMPIFPYLPELSSLDMRHNRLKNVFKEDFAPLPNLYEADLSHNEIRLIPDSFPANFSIIRLNLNKNKIKNLQGGFMDGCVNLTKLSMSRNHITKIEKGFFSTMSQLESLDMSNNRISEIEGITFKGLGKLQHLNLRRNLLQEMLDGAFYELQNLKKLQLDYNRIPTLRKAWLYGLPSLQHLNLSNNEISIIEKDAFEFCHDLQDLDLSNNLLTSLESNTFQHLSKLKRLDLSGNHMFDIAEFSFNYLPSLEVLILRGNILSHTIEDPNGAFSMLGGLLMLDLSSNNITAFNQKSFEGLNHMTHLDLTDNPIKTIHEKALESLQRLRHLDMNSHDLLCYCNIDWLPEYLLSKDLKLDLRCKHPKQLRGDLIRQLMPLSLPCEGFPKPAIVEEPRYLETKTGENITLTCRVSSTVQEPMKFQWKRDNIIISANKGQVDSGLEPLDESWQQYSTLNLININASDSAVYQCIVSNEYGTTFSKKAKVNVFTSPVFLKKPQNLTLKAGSTAKLECQAEGEPKPEISWHKDGGGYFPAASERRMHVLPADVTFFIVDVKFSDSGTYSCSAENLAGKVTTDVVLTVVEMPMFIKPMENKEITEGETTVLECMAGGHPKPKLRWTKDSQPLVATSRHFFTAENQLLIIVNSAKTDSGNYQCEISNSVGTERGSSRLTIIPRSVTIASSQSILVYVVVSVVCCIVVTSICWVGVIYHTRTRHSPTPTGSQNSSVPLTSVPVIVPFRDVDSESSKDSGHGDSARRSNEDLQLARGYSSESDMSEQAMEELEEEEPVYVSRSEMVPTMSTFRPYSSMHSYNSLPKTAPGISVDTIRE